MRSRKRTRETDVELNITAFLNLMVVLIPFLLLNAVFAQVSILQLNLPSNEEAPPSDPEENEKPVLEVLIYQDRYEVAERKATRYWQWSRSQLMAGMTVKACASFLARSRSDSRTSTTSPCCARMIPTMN